MAEVVSHYVPGMRQPAITGSWAVGRRGRLFQWWLLRAENITDCWKTAAEMGQGPLDSAQCSLLRQSVDFSGG